MRTCSRIFPIMLACVFFCLGGCCADRPANPEFALTVREAKIATLQMQEDPQPVVRPIVAVAGYGDRGLFVARLARDIRSLTTDDAPVVAVSFESAHTFGKCRQRLIETVEHVWPCDDPGVTTEVDVVAFSMGGLVARYAATTPEGEGKRLRIHRLFTIATPHRGAQMATVPVPDQRLVSMRPGSIFLQELDAAYHDAPYPIYPYGRRGDLQVGVENTAPPWLEPWWLSSGSLALAHHNSAHDPRILADIARRLRGEPSYAGDPIPAAAGEAETGP